MLEETGAFIPRRREGIVNSSTGRAVVFESGVVPAVWVCHAAHFFKPPYRYAFAMPGRVDQPRAPPSG